MSRDKECIYFDSFTSLRGIFTIGIILFHINGMFEKTSENVLGFAYHWGGHFGNCYFFILSGFLITHTYRNQIAINNIDLKQFIRKRLQRIYPLYFLSNLFMLLYNIRLNGLNTYFRPKDMLEIVLMVCSGWIDDIYPWNTPCWFLSMLVLCYFIYFFIAKLYIKYKDNYYLMILIFIFTGYILITRKLQFPFCYNHDGTGLFYFFSGVLLYDLLKSISSANHKAIIVFELAGGILFSLLTWLSIKNGFQNTIQEINIVMTWFIFPLLMLYGIHCKFFKKIMKIRPVYLWGKISFSACIWHIPVANIYKTIRNQITFLQIVNLNLQLILYFMLLLLISTISYWLIEKRKALDFCKRFIGENL